MMRRILICAALSVLAGCGVETATTAATGAAIKKQEIEQAKKTQDDAKQKLDQAMQRRADQAGDAAGR